jgi:hypothetical protein
MRSASTLIVGLALLGAHGPQPASQPQAPFRTGVDLVQVDVSVLDEDRCAEDRVFDALGRDLENVRFTEAVVPRTGEQKPVCPRCEDKYGRDKFPPGTLFQRDKKP